MIKMNVRAYKKTVLLVGCFLSVILNCSPLIAQAKNDKPLRLAVVGITHGHVPWILGRKDKTDVSLVGIYETDTALCHRYASQYNLGKDLFYTNLEKMLDVVKPEAIVAFGSIYEHMAAVEACAPRGIHVMVEKPLATNITDANRMQQLAKKYNIFLLTDFETSWYPTTEKTYQLVNDSNYVGKMRKVVIHDGHQGPKEIGVNKEFFKWLTDPVQNGGGALIDFGCYGANLMTYLMKGEKPVSVTAVTQHFKPAIYPKVDDEATIIVTYPAAQCIIQASWNWPFGRKDMEVYGETGYVITANNTNMRMRNSENNPELNIRVSAKEVPVYEDPFSYFADVVHKKIPVPSNGLYSLENNVTVVEILDAARESARTGKTVNLKQ
ncbi:Gfo/Idh/MocA family protein [Segetibacter koreensis]|uniref:Gfo/Idh/MocA family protein n=1 Tax=Segetibacter koreensis TaxID=398037 RepID=UPI00037C8641|nr:Gfo/Idh/MocA family oxidoreductase [Segetibacter koreensis]